nr:MAG TPA_asm: hypothetical protein [Caudoviricetes sp.]
MNTMHRGTLGRSPIVYCKPIPIEFLSNIHNAIENNPIKYKYVLPSTTTISIINLISCYIYRYWFRVHI